MVSIHLMLLFIKTGGINDGKIITVSIHLMLLFIEALLKISGLHIAVSIHLMLLFIEKIPLRQSERNWCFNTSHVTLYRR